MQERLMLALDVADRGRALELRRRLAGCTGWFKLGLRLFVTEGPGLVRELLRTHRVFLDLKFHDIPNTVAAAVESAGRLGVQMTNVHACGGMAMLRAAAAAARSFPCMKVIAVTVLTSDSMPPALARSEAVGRARMAQDAGLDGVVCSVHEVGAIKDACGKDFLTVAPGIRWGGRPRDDQRRVAGPAEAIRAGADFLVVGRPILEAPDPRAAALEALAMMEKADAGA